MRVSDSHAFGRAIREARKSAGLTQVDLAGLSGVGPRFIIELEKGKPSIELGKALHIATMLGLSLDLWNPGVSGAPPLPERQ